MAINESEKINGGLENLRVYLDERLTKLESKIDGLKQEIQAIDKSTGINAAKIEMLQHSQNVWFVVLTVVIGLVGFLVSFAPIFKEMYKDARKNSRTLTEENIRSVVRDEISRLKPETH